MDLRSFWDGAWPIVQPIGTTVAVVVFLVLARRFLDRRQAQTRHPGFMTPLIMLGLSLVGLVVIILALPAEGDLQGDLLQFFGILLTAAIALSSTTILGNAMAGVMIRAVRNFRTGDYLRVGDHFGRVSERGLFHTEIQTETRELTTLPNLYLVSHPVTVVRSSGTIVSATVSLGYDIDRQEIEGSLLAAAGAAGLEDPFVHILELGDFSVSYRVSGLLTEVDRLLTARARLHQACLDTLHAAGIEIVSPTFMNTRAYPEDRRFLSRPKRGVADQASERVPEQVVFDKAEEVSRLEKERAALAGEIEVARSEAKEAKDDAEAEERAARKLTELEERAKALDARIAGQKAEREG